ncbi:hypothetical protein ACPA54_15885 [Uniformispora flossi]|uniref:hypothetical protein n=1 Tax=Uniformispora flossi TaxID=3390723 RepID=UPI003C2CE15D
MTESPISGPASVAAPDPVWLAARPDDRLPSAFRFLTEIAAWVALPWAIADTSIVLGVFVGLMMVAVPTVFATPGDKRQVLVPVSGKVTIALVAAHILAALYGSWSAWPVWPAVPTTVVALMTIVTEMPRWRWLWGAAGRR